MVAPSCARACRARRRVSPLHSSTTRTVMGGRGSRTRGWSGPAKVPFCGHRCALCVREWRVHAHTRRGGHSLTARTVVGGRGTRTGLKSRVSLRPASAPSTKVPRVPGTSAGPDRHEYSLVPPQHPNVPQVPRVPGTSAGPDHHEYSFVPPQHQVPKYLEYRVPVAPCPKRSKVPKRAWPRAPNGAKCRREHGPVPQGGLVTVGPRQGTRYSRYLRYFWVLGRDQGILLNSNSCSF
jgi:hypothetical protein